MLAWLTNRRITRKQAAELLSQAAVQLEGSREAAKQALALFEKWAQICESQAAQLAEARAENERLWTALSGPKELQQYLAAGCSQAEAEQLAKDAPRGA